MRVCCAPEAVREGRDAATRMSQVHGVTSRTEGKAQVDGGSGNAVGDPVTRDTAAHLHSHASPRATSSVPPEGQARMFLMPKVYTRS